MNMNEKADVLYEEDKISAFGILVRLFFINNKNKIGTCLFFVHFKIEYMSCKRCIERVRGGRF